MNLNLYKLDNFEYSIQQKILKANNIIITTNYTKTKEHRDTYKFKSGFFNLESKNFTAQDTEISVKKNIFDNTDNDPRIKGVSSKKNGDITKINNAIFTSCKKNDKCPPWSIKAREITHDKKKKKLL